MCIFEVHEENYYASRDEQVTLEKNIHVHVLIREIIYLPLIENKILSVKINIYFL